MKTKIILGMTAFALASLSVGLQADSADSTDTTDTASLGNALVGTLFYTPLERDAIDRGSTPVDSVRGSADSSNQPPPAVLRFNGRVERSAGRTTAWVSGRPLERVQPGLPDTRLTLQGERLRIETPYSTRWLKAGEQFKPDRPEPSKSNDPAQPE